MLECTKFREYEKGTLQGFASIFVPKWGMEIFGCTLHQKGNNRWVNLPSKEYTDESGEKKFVSIIRFKEKAHYDAFLDQAKQAIDKWRKENAATAERFNKAAPAVDDCPF